MKPLPFQALTIRHSQKVNRIQTAVRITTAFDPKINNEADVPFYETSALWDTGATNSVITTDTAEKMGLIPVGSTSINHAGGTSVTKTYIVNFYLPNHVAIAGVGVSECPPAGFGAIIGMDIIGIGDFTISNANGKTCMTFRAPAHKETDYVLEAHKIQFANVKPYQPCPCGNKDKSGKPISFRLCHGKGFS